MDYKRLGTSKILVSELCLGTMYFGTSVDEKTSFKILDEFVSNGGNFIDTANNYCYWNGGTGDESEELIGKWMSLRQNRNNIVLASKVGARPKKHDPLSAFEGLSKKTIIKSVDASLKRLKISYLDVCYIHTDLLDYPLHERLEALYLLEKSGKIRFKGFSNLTLNRYKETIKGIKNIECSKCHCVQQKFSYMSPIKIDENDVLKFVNSEFISEMEKNEVSLLVYSVLLSGAYSRTWDEIPANYKSSMNKKLFEKMKYESNLMSCTPSQWVLNWIMKQSNNIIPIISSSNINQLKENILALELN